ncbi:hypothetical protein BT69DRAFT_1287540 [Atractiella rhizophila]|nr:hypothetical protein BT69DRAFT_1287540 [Atractiella rhizophila]
MHSPRTPSGFFSRKERPTTVNIIFRSNKEIAEDHYSSLTDAAISVQPACSFRTIFHTLEGNGAVLDHLDFLYNGKEINLDDTPEGLGMKQNDRFQSGATWEVVEIVPFEEAQYAFFKVQLHCLHPEKLNALTAANTEVLHISQDASLPLEATLDEISRTTRIHAADLTLVWTGMIRNWPISPSYTPLRLKMPTSSQSSEEAPTWIDITVHETFQIFVQKESKTHTVNVWPSATVEELKITIQIKMGIRTSSQRLQFGPKTLSEGHRTIADYGIMKNATIFLFAKPTKANSNCANSGKC